MNMSYPYDAAVSFVAEDALTARSLIARLRERLGASTFEPAMQLRDGTAHDGEELPAAVMRGSRVIIVLHQRLWGDTASTRLDRRAIELRAAHEGSGFLIVVSLEPEAVIPPCFAHGATCVCLSADGEREVEVIAEAIRRAGGSVQPARPPYALDGDGEGSMYEAPQSAAKEAMAAQRELNAVIAEIEARMKAMPAISPDVTYRVRRTPDRCVVQAGDIGLSVSWLPPGAAIAEGTLLVLEWDGTITFPGEPMNPRRRATLVSEQALHLESAPAAMGSGPVTWNWWSDGAPLRKYSSRDLAAQCVHQLVSRLEAAVAG